ncbi:MAG TPA: dephospho-CoA kinase [Flavobacterium sp.]|jgi:dephospho-CoA kinase
MKPKVIGLTGGIGSGKSTVARHFAALGVPVYIADDAAKDVMLRPKTIDKISRVFPAVVLDGVINRTKLSEIVFNEPEQLQRLNNIVHPQVRQHFEEWLLLQDCAFVIREAAILFESGSYLDCDKIITVTAPLETRISRVVERDRTTRENVLKRIENQWTDEMRISKSDYIIVNTDPVATMEHVSQIFKKLVNL